MKKIALFLFLMVSVLSFSQTVQTYFTCPMHAEIVSAKPGDCPKCGMSLVKKQIQIKAKIPEKPKVQEKVQEKPKIVEKPKSQIIQKTKPVISKKTKPEIPAKKSQSNPKIQQKPVSKTLPQAQKVSPMRDEVPTREVQPKEKGVNDLQINHYWTCPMHPEIHSDKPGKCPKCGMNLEEKNEILEKNNFTDNSQKLKRNSENGKVSFSGKTVRYDLYVKDTIVNFTGKNRRAIAINGKLNAPTLYFTEGDSAEIYLHNELKENTGLHWHGVILPNEMDGVPYLTTKPVKPGETHLYKFKISQNGTYWYHSHEALQEQIGMNGILVFNKRENTENQQYKADIPMLLGDWTDEKPSEVMRRLHMGNTDWYAIKKNAVQSYSEAIKSGNFGTKLLNEWKRMEAMDVSDVYYNKFLINGLPSSNFENLKAGDKVRLRIANGGSSTYFWLGFAGGKMTVIGNDGNEVEPTEVDRLIVGVSETYDVEVEIPENKQFEFRATAEDRTGFSSLWLGSGEKVSAPNLPKLLLFEGMKMMNGMMKMSGDMKPMDMKMGNQMMDMNEVMYPELPESKRKMTMQHMDEMMGNPQKNIENHHESINKEIPQKSIKRLSYNILSSTEKTSFPNENIRELNFTLEGNMTHYLWTLDNKTVTETDKILIKKGEILRISMYNNSMMRHPMHLHGHDFRLVNSNGDYSLLKNVVDIMPMETDVTEFPANQDGDWFFHCHILYHMMSGMGRVFSYENSKPNPELPDKKQAWKEFLKDNFMVSSTAMAEISTNKIHAETMTMFGSRWMNINDFHTNFKFNHYEGNVKLGRFLGKFQWAFPYVGFRFKNSHDFHEMEMLHEMGISHGHNKTWFGQNILPKNKNSFIAGFKYVLPMLIDADLSVDQNSKFLLEFAREDIPVSPRIRGNFKVNSDKEFGGGLRYILQKWLSVSAGYDSEMKWGAGIMLNY